MRFRNKEKQKIYARRHYIKNKELVIMGVSFRRTKRKMARIAYINEIKKELGCTDCRNNDFRVLEFHHIGEKSFTINEAITQGIGFERIKKEIEKCVIICANCHKLRHYNDLN